MPTAPVPRRRVAALPSGRGGRRWRRLREAVFAAEPLCRSCAAAGRTAVAVEVDHIVPAVLGGRDTPANLQPLCRPCHVAKTAADRLR